MLSFQQYLYKNKLFFFFLLIVATFTSYLFFYNLGKAPLDNWDEAWYGAVTRHMLLTHNFIVSYWNGLIYLDKPPFFMWLGGISSSILGLSEFALRLPSAIAGFIIVLLATGYSYKKFGLLPAFATACSLVLNNIFVWRARSANLDTFTAMLILVCFFVLIGKLRFRLELLGILFSCIYLTRASYIAFPLVIFACYELLFRRKDIFTHFFDYVLGLAIFVGISGIWLYLGYQQVGKTFIDYFLYHSDRNEASFALRNFKWDYVLYTYYSLQRRFFYIFILGVGLILIKKIRQGDYFLLFLFAIAPLVYFSFIQNKNNWYLIPLTPFWSIIIGYALYEIFRFFHKHWFILSLTTVAIIYISYKTFTGNIVPILNTQSAAGESKSGLYLKQHTKSNEILARVDSLYPTMVYYSDRKVLVSPVDSQVTNDYFINRSSLAVLIQQRQISWLAGEKRDIDFFEKQNPQFTYQNIAINQAEYIAQIKW